MGFFSFAKSIIDKLNFLAVPLVNSAQLRVGFLGSAGFYFMGDTGRCFRIRENNVSMLTLPAAATVNAACEVAGGRIVIFLQNLGFYTSDDSGASWTLRQAAAVSMGGIAFGGGVITAQQSLSSTGWRSLDNGTTWSSAVNIAQATSNASISQSIVYYSSIKKFIRVGGAGFIATSSDGLTWAAVATGAANTVISQGEFLGSFYFGTTGGEIFRSSDLVNFSQVLQNGMAFGILSGTAPPQITNFALLNNDLYYFTSVGQIAYSSDGVSFDLCTSMAGSVSAVASNNNYLYLCSGAGIFRSMVS